MPANAAIDADPFDRIARLAGMKLAGGPVVVQDLANAEVPATPEAAIRRMAPGLILPHAEIRSLLRRLAEHR